MKHRDELKKQLCDQIHFFTDRELYEFITRAKPFRILLCEKCVSFFGECPESMENDLLCRERFSLWCDKNVSASPDNI